MGLAPLAAAAHSKALRQPPAGAAQGPARPGIDVLLADSLHLVAGRRVGLITNQSGLDASGVPTIDRLSGAPGVRLVALFAPEHGIRGRARPGEAVSDTVDLATGIPIYSLYGANRAPTADQLGGIDVLVVDLQDVGARPFTYVSTTVLAMEAARAAGRRIIVLDRPNPIGCDQAGPVMETAWASFIGMLAVPLRHGLTLGELARFANGERRLGADLVVVPVEGWRRCQWFDETGLPWVPPSPNLPDLESVRWYPGTVLFEATKLSVGRGSDRPFRMIGAPWLDPEAVLAVDRGLADWLEPTSFLVQDPGDGKYPGRQVRGLRIREGRPRSADPVELGMRLMNAVVRAHPDSARPDSVGLARRLGVYIRPGSAPPCAPTGEWCGWRWPSQVAGFRLKARRYLLYR